MTQVDETVSTDIKVAKQCRFQSKTIARYIHNIITFPSFSYLPNKEKKNGAGCDSKGGNPNGAQDDASESRRASEPRKEASVSAKAPRGEAAKSGSKSV